MGVALALAWSAMGAAEPDAPEAAPSWNAPPRAARQKNPLPASAGAASRIAELYRKECLPCHGPQGAGDGPKASDLKVHPGDLSSPKTLEQSDGALFWKIRRGRTPMPSYRSFSEKDCWALVHYLRTFRPALADAQPSQEPARAPARERKPAPPSARAGQSKPETAEEVTAPATDGASLYVRREEYDQLKQEIADLKALLQQGRQGQDTNALPPEVADAIESVSYLEEAVGDLEHKARMSATGTTRTLLSGFASAGFAGREHGDSSFSASIAPLFLWQVSDQMLVEAEIDARLDRDDTDVDLVRSQLYYVLNDWVTFGAGKFLSPMNFLEDRLHQVNKLPDAPVAIATLLPKSHVGLQVRGAVPVRATKFDYALYAANAPTIEAQEPARLGTLEFDNFDNLNGNIAVGGRLGFFPIPELQLGYGFQVSDLNSGAQETSAILHSLDLNYVHDTERLKGTINLLAQWAWSDVGALDYDPDGTFGFGPVRLANRRDGGYIQLAYRPTRAESAILSRMEPILRYDRLRQRKAPAGFDQQRWTFGLNYWLLPSAVLKAAYQFDDRSDGADSDAILLQFKIGF